MTGPFEDRPKGRPGGDLLAGQSDDGGDESGFRVVDRRHTREDAETGASLSTEYPTVVEQFRHRAEEAERKLHEYIAAFKEERAGLEALRGRLRDDVGRRVREELGRAMGRFLEVVDNLDRALEHAAADDPLRDGVEATRAQLLGVMSDLGVTRIEPEIGARFDPHEAEAVMARDTDADRDGQVLEVVRPGYGFDGRVLRAPQVIVGKAS